MTHSPGKYGLMRKGKLLRLMRGEPHPQQVTRQARKLAAAVALAASDSPAEAVQKLDHAGLVTDQARALGQELGVSVRFKPILPLGRAATMPLRLKFDSSLDDDADAIALQSRVVSTCGLGMNLYIGPRGECFPCYALTGAQHALGNALDDGLVAVLERNNAYRRATVDSNPQCRTCALRYLCGGFCRAWNSNADPDAPPTGCAALHERAHNLLAGTLGLDRGWPEDEFFAFTETRRQDLYRRYTAVIHLVTAADGAAWAYKKWPEAHRPQEPADAIRLDRLLQQAWGGHPNYFRIDNDGRDWLAKSRVARDVLARWL